MIGQLSGIGAKISKKPTDPLSGSEYRYSLATGVSEYMLGADYEGDSVAYEEIPPTPLHKGGEKMAQSSVSPSLVSQSSSWIHSSSSFTSRIHSSHSFLDPLTKGVASWNLLPGSRGIFGLDLASPASAAT